MEATITIPVPPELADLYERSSEADRARIALWLREEIGALLGSTSDDDLPQLMSEIGLRAQARGLTPEILDDLLRDDE